MKFIEVEDIENLYKKEIDKIYRRHYNPGLYKIFKFIGIDKEFVEAHGMYVYDKDGCEYIDFLGGFGALNLGHNNEEVLRCINQIKYRPNMLQVSKNTFAAVLANNISYITKGDFTYCYFTNSGTETVEEAIKLALLYKNEGNIIYFSNAYHGKTLGSISALGNNIKYNYDPLFYNFIEVPFEDIEAFKEAVKLNKISAVIVEPLQSEGGIKIAADNFFKKLRKICDKEDIILIFDEIQTGLGRCGAMFLYEKIGVVPDIMCISKSLSGGIIPIGCVAVEDTLWEDTYGKIKKSLLLSSTFGGNTLACAAGIKTLSLIENNKLYESAENLGRYTMKLLKELKNNHKIIKDVRGKGLLLGIEFDDLNGKIPKKIMKIAVSNIISRLMNDFYIITGFTINNPAVLRVEPPLIVNKEQIDYFVNCLDKILKEEDNLMKFSLYGMKNIGNNILH